MSEIELTDAILRHALELQRLSAHEEAQAEAILRELEQELRSLLSMLSGRQKREVEALIKAAEEAIDARYAVIAGQMDTRGLVLLVADRTVEAMQQLGDIARPSLEVLESLSRENLVEGTPAKDWWQAQSDATQRNFAGQVRQGVINGETNEQITARIVGRRGEPGVIDLSRRQARSLVHNAIMSAANQARLATYRKNMRFASGVKWLATLDSHTCRTCAALDGQAWDFDGKALGKTTMLFRAPPAHFSCRCVLTPIPPSFDDIFGQSGLDDILAGIGARASSQGPVRSGTTFAEFLKRQSPEFVADVLGTKRAERYLLGLKNPKAPAALTLRDLVSGTGRPLTLEELRVR